MSASRISEAEALSVGADLWIVRNDPSLNWWKQLDLNSHYLISENFLKEKKPLPLNIQNILNATNLDLATAYADQPFLLIGTEDHFFNKWILLWNTGGAPADLPGLIERIALQLKTSSIRFFSDAVAAATLAARPTASSLSISYIENI
jgi:hypothetical protein